MPRTIITSFLRSLLVVVFCLRLFGSPFCSTLLFFCLPARDLCAALSPRRQTIVTPRSAAAPCMGNSNIGYIFVKNGNFFDKVFLQARASTPKNHARGKSSSLLHTSVLPSPLVAKQMCPGLAKGTTCFYKHYARPAARGYVYPRPATSCMRHYPSIFEKPR